jgi:UV DNA damage endonuclease
MIKRTFLSKGLDYCSELAYKNLLDLQTILSWNIDNGISVFRMSSDMFPWMSEYEISTLPNWEKIKTQLETCGKIIKDNNLRVSFHPGPFTVLGSKNLSVVINSIKELHKHDEIMNWMSLEASNDYHINIHLNSADPSREEGALRFINGYNSLNETTKKRLTIENDDKLNQYSVKHLYDLVHVYTGIPIVFDFLHHTLGPQDQSREEAFKLAYSTWNVKPLVHYSSSKILEDSAAHRTAHSNYIHEKIPTYQGYDYDCEIEAKSKDLALLKYLKEY